MSDIITPVDRSTAPIVGETVRTETPIVGEVSRSASVPSAPLSTAEAAAKIQKLTTPRKRKPAAAPAAPAPEPVITAAASDVGPDESVDEIADEDVSEPDEPSADDAPADEAALEGEDAPEPTARTWKVKDGDTEREVTEDELLNGFQFAAATTKKAQKLAEERREWEQREKPALVAERQQYAQALAQIAEVLGEPPEPDWAAIKPTLSSEDYLVARREWDDAKEQRQIVARERDVAQQKVRADQEAGLRAHLEAEHGKLLAALPEWHNSEVAKKEQAEMRAFANGLGFTDQEIGSVTDHRTVQLLRKAMLYDQLQKEKPVAQRQIDKVRAATPGPSATTRPKVDASEAALARLRKTGSVHDAAAAIQGILSGSR